jgi:hypothetical protein
MLKKWIENIIYLAASCVSIGTFVYAIYFIIGNYQKLNAESGAITNIGAIFAICSGVSVFLADKKSKRLEQSMKIVEDFDNEYFMGARNLTRSIAEQKKKNQSYDENTLIKLINYKKIDREDNKVKELKDLCDFSEEDCKKLRQSIIFTFNYWEKVYFVIIYNAADNDYLFQLLSNIYISQYNRFKCWIKETMDEEMQEHLERLYEMMCKYPVWYKHPWAWITHCFKKVSLFKKRGI